MTYRSDTSEGPTEGAETVDPLEFLARVLVHIPNKGSISRIHRIGQCEIFSCSIDFMKLAFSVFRRVLERSN